MRNILYVAAVKFLNAIGLGEFVRSLVLRFSRAALYRIDDESPVPQKQLISVAPHNLQLFDYFIRLHLAKGHRFITSDDLYGKTRLRQDQGFILIRHDVDFTPEGLSALVEVERKYGIKADIHLIMDKEYYDVRPFVPFLKELGKEGYSLGLHTVAPPCDDFYTVLRDEITRFTDLLGEAPRTFSIHGICPHPQDWQNIRQNFLKKINQRLPSFGFVGSHNISGVDFWVEDTGVGGEFSYLFSNWLNAQPTAGQVMGVLAHPDHWVEWPLKWHFDPNKVMEAEEIEEFVSKARAYAPERSSSSQT